LSKVLRVSFLRAEIYSPQEGAGTTIIGNFRKGRDGSEEPGWGFVIPGGKKGQRYSVVARERRQMANPKKKTPSKG